MEAQRNPAASRADTVAHLEREIPSLRRFARALVGDAVRADDLVQDALERALSGIAAAPVSTVCAGRTDTGVHALMQVVHFDAPTLRPEQAWVRGVNALLPDAIAVVGAAAVPDDFHARHDAVLRAKEVRAAQGQDRRPAKH
jgi:tRNA pseudouridine38-40 synthase